jgi:DNA-binding IclR family transcriptional regulator
LLNTIDRTGKVLNLFTAEAPDWGVTEVAAALDLAKSTTFDILTSLAEIGLLQQTSDDRYRLGWRLLAIGRQLHSSCLAPHAHRAIAELAQHLGAVVTIGAWDGQAVMCIASAPAPLSGCAPTQGAHLPGHASALGKLLMAQLSWSKAQEYVDQCDQSVHTNHAVAGTDTFRAQLSRVLRQGLAVEHGEVVPGRSCIAVGIHDREGRVVAALSICTPTQTMRYRCDEYVRIARRAARSLQR